MGRRLTCEFGADKKEKGFRPRFENENLAADFYCASTKWKQGKFWRLCKDHWLTVGYSLRDWERDNPHEPFACLLKHPHEFPHELKNWGVR